jgi:hypothetical protein
VTTPFKDHAQQKAHVSHHLIKCTANFTKLASAAALEQTEQETEPVQLMFVISGILDQKRACRITI